MYIHRLRMSYMNNTSAFRSLCVLYIFVFFGTQCRFNHEEKRLKSVSRADNLHHISLVVKVYFLCCIHPQREPTATSNANPPLPATRTHRYQQREPITTHNVNPSLPATRTHHYQQHEPITTRNANPSLPATRNNRPVVQTLPSLRTPSKKQANLTKIA